MTTQLLRKERAESLPQGIADSTRALVKNLVREITEHLETPAESAFADPQGVLLDMELDGVRCLIIRARPQPQRAQMILSPREHEIVRMVAEGYPNKTIAAVLDISTWTVGTHLRRVFAKLGVGSRAAMVARLLEGGVTEEQLTHSETPQPRRR